MAFVNADDARRHQERVERARLGLHPRERGGGMSRVHAEIQYGQVHSDICPPGCTTIGMGRADWRALMHRCLDEFIDKAPTADDPNARFHITMYPSREE